MTLRLAEQDRLFAVSRGQPVLDLEVIPVSPRDRSPPVPPFLLRAGVGIAAASAAAPDNSGSRSSSVAAGLGLALAATFILTAAGLAVDLARPLLDWINPQKAIKQNLNVLIAFLVDLGFLALFGYACNLLRRLGLTAGSVLGLLGLLLGGLAVSSWSLLGKLADKRYPAIEV
jgi:hypothetical protein